MIDYNNLIVNDRKNKENTTRLLSEEFLSDKNRIIFSSPFRRLQQKAQVFSLETNAAVRSRLTHTLEVAVVGTTIAEKISALLVKDNKLDENKVLPFIRIVENACLLHDIGNPPFGHFAESAIKIWFKNSWEEIFQKAIVNYKIDFSNCNLIKNDLIYDFLNFDGNPQGVRIASKLQEIPGEHNDVGFNLTKCQILSIVKYNPSPNAVDNNKSLFKKPGYFYSEKIKIEKIRTEFDWYNRFPFTFIMESADDISYCLSDIEDGIEKNIFSSSYFFEKLISEWETVSPNVDFPFAEDITGKNDKNDFFYFKIKITRKLIEYAANSYINNHDKIKDNLITDLIDIKSHYGMLLKVLKNISRKYLFRSADAENKELAGYNIITGILNAYKPILDLDYKVFGTLVKYRENIDAVLGKDLDYAWRLFNRLPKKYVLAYNYDVNLALEDDKKTLEEQLQLEWFYRSHLIIDYISGMTDSFALETYRLLYGIKI